MVETEKLPAAATVQWVAKDRDYHEAHVSDRIMLDAIEGHSGWKGRVWVRDQHDEKRWAGPCERIGLKSAEEAKSAAIEALREWLAAETRAAERFAAIVGSTVQRCDNKLCGDIMVRNGSKWRCLNCGNVLGTS